MDASTVDLIFKIGTPVALVILAALSSRFVTRKEYDDLKRTTESLGVSVALLTQRLDNDAYVKKELSDHGKRIRDLELKLAGGSE